MKIKETLRIEVNKMKLQISFETFSEVLNEFVASFFHFTG